MRFELAALDRRTMTVVALAGIVFAGFMMLALTGTVAAGAGHETSSCMGRFV